MATQPDLQKRRSSRLQFRCRVKIIGIDREGITFSEETVTTTISKFGACLETKRPYSLGQTLTVQTLDRGHTGQFQIVWLGQAGTREAGQIGIEWFDARRFWGIEFPPEDWGGR
jgi:hypothetical protein